METEKSLDGLDFGGYGRADCGVADGLRISQNAMIEMD